MKTLKLSYSYKIFDHIKTYLNSTIKYPNPTKKVSHRMEMISTQNKSLQTKVILIAQTIF